MMSHRISTTCPGLTFICQVQLVDSGYGPGQPGDVKLPESLLKTVRSPQELTLGAVGVDAAVGQYVGMEAARLKVEVTCITKATFPNTVYLLYLPHNTKEMKLYESIWCRTIPSVPDSKMELLDF